MTDFTHYLPITSLIVSLTFFGIIFRKWTKNRSSLHLLWWAIGALMYAAGTFTEAFTTLAGWNLIIFKMWYITGALLGGAPLAQGTVYLLLPRKTAHILSVVLVAFVAIASVFVILSPVNMEQVDPAHLSGSVLTWGWVRAFSPFANTYALIFLVGGAIWSAWKYRKTNQTGRILGNILIALGGLLPGIGGSFTRFGHVEVLFVTELIGIILIWIGYETIEHSPSLEKKSAD
jgi:hypothetical protein